MPQVQFQTLWLVFFFCFFFSALQNVHYLIFFPFPFNSPMSVCLPVLWLLFSFPFQLTHVSVPVYVIASVVGMTPLALVNCYVGSTFRSMEEVWSDSSSHATGYLVFIGQVSDISRSTLLNFSTWHFQRLNKEKKRWNYLFLPNYHIIQSYFCKAFYS